MRATTSREQVQQDSPPKAQSIYSITSSAVASRVGGTVTPSVFAVLEVDDHLVRKHRSTREGEALMAATAARVLSVNVGAVREFEYNGRPAKSGIWKSPVAGRIAARGINLDGDEQADRKAHGGPDKVIYAYAVEDARWWEQEIDRPLGYGEFGENLTTEGIEVNDALIGERWKIGTTILEVSEPRIPCWRLGVRMNDQLFPRRFTEASRPGTYLRIVVEGDVGAGDEIRVVEKPDHGLTVRHVFRIYTRDRHEADRLLAVPQISESWRSWASNFLQRTKGRSLDTSEPGCCST
jgi:MOSC domain-containing protein YiiM